MRKITPKQQKFADKYIECGNATQSAIDAGYSKRYAHTNAAKLLQNTTISDYITKRMKALESEKIASANEVLQYLTSVLRGDATETITVGTGKGAYTIDDSPPMIRDRLAAGRELLKRYPGGNNLLDAQTRKAVADADMAEMQRDELKGKGYRNPLLDAIAKGAANLIPKEGNDEDKPADS